MNIRSDKFVPSKWFFLVYTTFEKTKIFFFFATFRGHIVYYFKKKNPIEILSLFTYVFFDYNLQHNYWNVRVKTVVLQRFSVSFRLYYFGYDAKRLRKRTNRTCINIVW